MLPWTPYDNMGWFKPTTTRYTVYQGMRECDGQAACFYRVLHSIKHRVDRRRLHNITGEKENTDQGETPQKQTPCDA